MLDRYITQVRLLLDVLRGMAQETAFALKGGTAINFFYRDMPRLSVDLDLTWLPVGDRSSALQGIDRALDRQHPRDLFDIKSLYDNEGLTDDLFRVFMVYLAGSRRPMHELLAPASELPLRNGWYDNEFAGMTRITVPSEALVDVGQRLQADVGSRLTGKIAAFLLSLHDAEPNFGLIGLPDAAELPAVRWKQVNLEKWRPVKP